MDKIESHEGENQEENQADEVKIKIDKSQFIAIALIGLVAVWLNFSFVIWALTICTTIFALFLLIFGGIWSAKLMFKPRRIVTADQAAKEMTLLEHMLETQDPTVNPFIGRSTWKNHVKDSDAALSWEVQRGLNFESNACLLWMLSIIFLTATATDRNMGLYNLAFLAVTGLFINWLIQLRFFLVWRVMSKKPAKTEHYGLWLFERIQYGCVVMYCLAFIAEKFRIF